MIPRSLIRALMWLTSSAAVGRLEGSCCQHRRARSLQQREGVITLMEC
jgi:hypothetical protein